MEKLIAWATGQIDEVLRQKLEYLPHHQHEHNQQGLANVIPFPAARTGCQTGTIPKAERERLGGLLNFYHRAA